MRRRRQPAGAYTIRNSDGACAKYGMVYQEDLCNGLMTNDPQYTHIELWIDHCSDGFMDLIVGALQKNSSLKTLEFESRERDDDPRSIRTSTSVAKVLANHPTVKKLSFRNVSISDFSAFALRVHQNERLTRLRLVGCKFETSSVEENLQLILKEDILHELTLVDCNNHEGFIDLSEAILETRSLTSINQSYDDLTEGTTEALPQVLQQNEGMKWVDFSLPGLEGDTSELLSNIAEAATGHSSLEELRLTGNGYEELQLSAARAIGNMLRSFGALRTLHLSFVQLDSLSAQEELADGLKHNKTLTELHLFDNELGSDGFAALADALAVNDTLQEFPIEEDEINHWSTVKLAQTLTINTSLKRLEVGFDDNDADMKAFSACLPRMRGLKTMDVGIDMDNVTLETKDAFLNGLEQNTVLHISFQSGTNPFQARVQHLPELNRGGRRALASQPPLPPTTGHDCCPMPPTIRMFYTSSFGKSQML